MNPDELRELFAGNLDEPPLPGDPVESVRQRRRQLRLRRRLATMTVVLALAGTAGGIWSVLPGGGHSQSGPSVLDEDTRTPTPTGAPGPSVPMTNPTHVVGVTVPAVAPTPHPLVSARITQAPTRAPATTAPVQTSGVTATFNWSIGKVDAGSVLVGGSWAGNATTASAALLADPNHSGAVEAGSGVLGYLVTALGPYNNQVGVEHQWLPTTNGDERPPGGSAACDGPVVAQHRALAPVLLTFNEAGRYVLTMRTDGCSADGQLVTNESTTTVTVGESVDDFHTALSLSGGASLTLGSSLQLAGSGSGPFSPATGLLWVLTPDGVFHLLNGPATSPSCNTGTSASTTTSTKYTPTAVGAYTFGYAYGCDISAAQQGQHGDADFQSAQSVVSISVVPGSQ
jgi:hypothetical protein